MSLLNPQMNQASPINAMPFVIWDRIFGMFEEPTKQWWNLPLTLGRPDNLL
jgi:hypothetical protein